MRARRAVIALLAAVTLAVSGGYLFVYLYRWEWNRAIISGVIFLAAEIALIGWLLNGRLKAVSDSLSSSLSSRAHDQARHVRIAGHLSDARDRPSTVFDWLSPRNQRTGVFVPILMGAGLVVSGLAWLVEWLGRNTASRLSDDQLARGLAGLAPPPGGFLDDSHDVLRDLRAPRNGVS